MLLPDTETPGSPAEWKQLRQELETLREARARTSRTEMLFNLMAENVADLLAVIDPQGKRIWNNSSYFSILGYSPEALEGTDSLAEIHPEDKPRLQKLFQNAVLTGIGHKAEYRMRHFKGHWVSLESNMRVVANDKGVVEHLVLVARDLNDVHKKESELSKTEGARVISDFAQGLGQEFHEVLDTLENAFSHAEVALEKNLPEQAKAHLNMVQGATLKTRKILQNLSDLGYGRNLETASIPLDSFLKEIVSQSLSGRDLQSECRISPALKQVKGNRALLSCAIKSILDNCVEAMNGEGTVSIQAEKCLLELGSPSRVPQLQPGNYVKITVSDRGPGMTDEKAARVFEPYFTTKCNRTGLGLTSALSIVSRHHGTITVDSKPGKGSAFHVFLPASDDIDKPSAPPVSKKTGSSAKRIIFMDDQALVRKFVGRLLTAMGYEIALASHGKEVIELYRQAMAAGDCFDAVIMDLLIPNNVGGAAAIHTLRQMDDSIIAIASSGYVDQPVMQDPRAFGFTAAIAKPYNRERLSEVLSEAFRPKS